MIKKVKEFKMMYDENKQRPRGRIFFYYYKILLFCFNILTVLLTNRFCFVNLIKKKLKINKTNI